MELEIFSDKTNIFRNHFSDKFELIYGKILKWKIMENFTHMLVDIQKQLEILAKKVETFSDRTDLFTYNISEKTEEIHE